MTKMININEAEDEIKVVDVDDIDSAKKAISQGYIELDKLRKIVNDDSHKFDRMIEINNLVIGYDGVGEHEYVVTINLKGNSAWKSLPIGQFLSIDDAYRISEWLKTSIKELIRITDSL